MVAHLALSGTYLVGWSLHCFALPSAFEAVMLEYFPLVLYVTVVFEGLVHLEVVAPAGKLQAIVAHLLGERHDFL